MVLRVRACACPRNARLRTHTRARLVQERVTALTAPSAQPNPGRALLPTAAPAFRTAPPRTTASGTFAVPQSVHKSAAYAEPASFNLHDDWDAVQFEQIESFMAAAGALGTSTGAAHAVPTHGASTVPSLGATQAVQTLALRRMESATGDSG